MKYKITIRRTITEEYEIVRDDYNMIAAIDEARKLVAARNEKSELGKFSVSKIESIEESNDEAPSNIPS